LLLAQSKNIFKVIISEKVFSKETFYLLKLLFAKKTPFLLFFEKKFFFFPFDTNNSLKEENLVFIHLFSVFT
jgi:hypothetical protein